MDLMKWEPFGELSSLRRQMDRLWDSFFGREPAIFERGRWVPAVDVSETKDEIVNDVKDYQEDIMKQSDEAAAPDNSEKPE